MSTNDLALVSIPVHETVVSYLLKSSCTCYILYVGIRITSFVDIVYLWFGDIVDTLAFSCC